MFTFWNKIEIDQSVALQNLAAPVSSGAVERLFS